MVQINFAQKEIQCKIVYYGPGMSGKTTNLEVVHGKVPSNSRGELTSIATTGERTLYFDYMPLDLGQIAGIRTKFQLYTVPGQIYYKSTRRLVLQGVDGIIFVADSSAEKLKENQESLQDLEDNLREMGKSLRDLPMVIQYNKRDLPDAMSVEDLQRELNPDDHPHFEAVAVRGEGVFPALKDLAGRVLDTVNKGGLAGARPRPVARPAGARPTAVAAPPPPSKAKAREPALAAAPAGGAARAKKAAAAQGPEAGAKGGGRPGPDPPSSPPEEGSGASPPPAKAPPSRPAAPTSLQDRVVSVRRLRTGSGTNLPIVLALGALILGAIVFVLTRF